MSKIITFYSYKGGVGRSMALANVGVMLAQWGAKVLIVDFDLEAPGLEYFFKNGIRNFDRTKYESGLIDLLNQVSVDSSELPWKDIVISASTILKPSGTNFWGYTEIGLDLILSGGNGDSGYIEKLKKFNAADFYRNHNGGIIIETLREQWLANYDFILIDSRTGITDIGGICTIHLPDILITLFTATEQGWVGTKDVVQKAIKNHNKLPFDRDRLKVLPIPTRIDNSEQQLTDEWLSKFSNEIGPIVSNWLDKRVDPRTFVDKIFIPYVPYYSFGENLPVSDNISNPLKMGYSFVNISALIVKGLTDNKLYFDSRDEYIREAERLIKQLPKRNIQSANEYQNEVKLIVIGEGGSGKTSFVRRLIDSAEQLPSELESTKGVEISKYIFKTNDSNAYCINIWDFGGQEIYHATHQFFLTKRSLYVLIDDTRKDHKIVHDEGFKYWLEAVDLLGGHSPVLIFQNQKGDRVKQIDLGGIKGKFDNVIGVWSGNLERADSVDKIREAIKYYASSMPQPKLPIGWRHVRAELEEMAKTEPYISQKDYFQVYSRHLEFNRAEALHLSQYLHELGVFLHFQDDSLLVRTIILQNTWVTEAVFTVLDDEMVKSKLGRFTQADCQRVWAHPSWVDMYTELLSLMQKFELCYVLPDVEPKTWLVPQLLPPSKPKELADWVQSGDLVLRYRYEFLPKGLVTRLLVRQHRFIPRLDMAWISGVLFERDGSQVLMEIPPKGGEITLRARGYERKELLSVIAKDLDSLNETFHGLPERVSKLIPCNCNKCLTQAEPEFFEQKRLLQRKRDGKLKVECPGSYEEVDVLQLLDGVSVKQLPGWAKESKSATTPEVVAEIHVWVEENETQKALEVFKKINPKAAAVLLNNFKELKTKHSRGVLEEKDFLLEKAKINSGLLDLLDT